MDLLGDLNPQQREAVTAPPGPVLVLAGPGSGKTRVLTHRIAYLIRELDVPASHIMAVTFTNKAARAMRARLETLIGAPIGREAVSLGTFHALCARMLRREADRLGFSREFVIFDDADQLAVMRRRSRSWTSIPSRSRRAGSLRWSHAPRTNSSSPRTSPPTATSARWPSAPTRAIRRPCCRTTPSISTTCSCSSQHKVILGMARMVNEKAVTPTVILESNQIQRALREPLLDMARAKGIQLIVELSHTGAEKHDEATGIEACAADFQNGWVSLPCATPADEEKLIGFENCMLEYGTSKYYDVPIAYWKARGFLYERRYKPHLRQNIIVRQLPRYMQAHYRRMGVSELLTVTNAHSLPAREETMLQ